MKKNIFSLMAMLVFALTTKAQMFNGIFIGGSLSSFHSKMIAKGYKYKEAISPNVYLYSGKIGVEQVEVFVMASPKSKIVSKVNLFFPIENSYESLLESMNEKKDLYTQKYGECEHCVVNFSTPYFEGDGYEQQAVETGNYTNSCIWLLPNEFAILLKVFKTMQIEVTYENTKNHEITIKEYQNSQLEKL